MTAETKPKTHFVAIVMEKNQKMSIVADYAETLTDFDRLAIIRGYEQLERDGAIGDDPIRVHTELLLAQYGIDQYSVVVWMTQMAFECYRHYANRLICKSSLERYTLW